MFKAFLLSFVLLISSVCVSGDEPKFVVFSKRHDPAPRVCHSKCFREFSSKRDLINVIGKANNKKELFRLPKVFYGTGITCVNCEQCQRLICENSY